MFHRQSWQLDIEDQAPARHARRPGRGRAGRRRAAALLVTGLLAGMVLPLGTATAAAQKVAAVGLHEDTSPSLTWRGPWKKEPSPATSGGTLRTLAASGSATLVFDGAGVSWIARKSSFDGIAAVYLDGRRTAVDLYAPRTTHQQVAFVVRGLRPGRHTLRIERTGTKNRASAGRNVSIDALRVLDSTPPPAPTRVAATGDRSGARVTWTASAAADVTGYRVTRQLVGRPAVVVGTVGGRTLALADAGLATSATYDYRVVALDSSGNVSSPSTTARIRTAPRPAPTRFRHASCPSASVVVGNGQELTAALEEAGPGSVVVMRPGVYRGQVNVTVTGSAAAPVWLCGSRDAVVDGGGVDRNGGIRVANSSHLVVTGMTVRNSQKGVSVIAGDSVTVSDLHVTQIGHEAIHLKNDTTRSEVVANQIDRTGLSEPLYGEGVYVGTDMNNWCAYSDCRPDRSDANVVVGNTITATTAEPVEVKEGTTGGLVADNVLDGSGTVPGVDRLLAVKGNDWVVTGNRGQNAGVDGVQVLERIAGWGRDNVLYANTFGGRHTAYGVRVPVAGLGNVVGCDTTIPSSARAVSNVPCQP